MTATSVHGSISGRDRRAWRAAMLIALLFATTLIVFWNGVGVNDADKYVRYALRLVDGESWLGRNHWSLRLSLVAPIAASFKIFGVSEFASTVPNILYAAGLVAATFAFARRSLGLTAATAAAALVASSAYLCVAQSEVAIFGPEILAGAIACWLFHEATTGKIDNRRVAAAGLAAGFAFYCRETAVFLPLTFGVLLLLRRPLRLDSVAALAAGFAIVVGAEMAAYAALTGDPFYRLAIDFGHRGSGDFFELPHKDQQNPLIGRLTIPLSYLVTAPAVTPFIIIAAIVLAHQRLRRPTAPAVFILAAAMNFLFSAYAANLKEPDYYPMLTYAAMLAIGCSVASLVERGAGRTGAALLAGVIFLNWAAADFRRYDENAEARRLAAFVADTGRVVTTDPKTAARTRLMLRFHGADRPTADRLVLSERAARRPLCGLVYSATPARANRAIKPEPGWTPLWSAEVRKRRLTVGLVETVAPTVALSERGRNLLRIAGPVALFDAGPCGTR